MKKPLYQRLITIIYWIGGGILLLGALLDSVVNTLTLIDIPSAIVISLSLIGLYILVTVILRFIKIIWVNNEGEGYRVKKLGKEINFSLIGIIVLLWIGALINYSQQPGLPEPVFSQYDQGFKVLILPFHKECEYENKQYDIGQVIQKRLQERNIKESINLQVHYLTDSIDFNNFTAEKADSIRKYHAANMIVYGFYSYSQCEGNTSDKICYNYISDYKEENVREKWAHTEYRMQDFKGLDDIRKGTGQENIDYVIYYITGVSLSLKREFIEALNKFQKIKFDANDERMLNRIANCYYEMRMYDSALKYQKAVLKIRPNNSGYLSNIGASYVCTGKYSDATKYYAMALVKAPDDINCLRNLTFIYLEERDTAKAKEYFDRIVKLVPENDYCNYRELADVYSAMGKSDKANEVYCKYLNHFDSSVYDADDAIEKSKISLDIGDKIRAEKYLKKAVEIDSTYAYGWFKLGEYYLNIKENYLQSLVCLKRVVALHPYDAIAWAMLSIDYYNNNQPGKAIECIEKSLALTEQSAYALGIAAQVYAGTNQMGKAFDCIKKAISLSPNRLSSLKILGDLYLLNNETQKAFETFKKVWNLTKDYKYAYLLAQLAADLRNKKDALHYLTQACKMAPQIKIRAKNNKVLNWLWDTPEFNAIVN